MLAVSEFNEIDRLDNLQDLWKSLWERTRDRSFFQTLDWLKGYWRHFGVDSKLRVLMVSVGGRPIGFVPLVVKTMVTPMGSMRVLTDPLDEWGSFYRPIGPHPAATLKAAVDYLRTSTRDWDVIDLRHIDADGSDRGRMLNALRSNRMTVKSSVESAVPVINVDGDFEDYIERQSDQRRHGIKTAERRLADRGKLTYRRFRTNADLRRDESASWTILSELGRLTSATQRCAGALGVERHLVVHFDCLRELHDSAAAAGLVDLNLLYLNDEPVAGAYGYQCDGLVEIVHTASRGRLASVANNVLMARMLRDSFERQDRRLVFNTATSSLAEGWLTSAVNSHRYTHFAPLAPRAQLLRANCSLRAWLGDDAPVFSRETSSSVDSEKAPVAEQDDEQPQSEPRQLRIFSASV